MLSVELVELLEGALERLPLLLEVGLLRLRLARLEGLLRLLELLLRLRLLRLQLCYMAILKWSENSQP